LLAGIATLLVLPAADACTGISLIAKDGAVVYGRTMEWGSFDLNSQVVIVSRGRTFTAHTPDKKPGVSWTGQYGFVGLDGLDAEVIPVRRGLRPTRCTGKFGRWVQQSSV